MGPVSPAVYLIDLDVSEEAVLWSQRHDVFPHRVCGMSAFQKVRFNLKPEKMSVFQQPDPHMLQFRVGFKGRAAEDSRAAASPSCRDTDGCLMACSVL